MIKVLGAASRFRFLIIMVITLFFVQMSFAQNIPVLQSEDFNKKLVATANALVLDVRTPKEFSTGHLPNAVNINFNDAAFDSSIATLDKSQPVFVYCLAGGRSAGAAQKLKAAGFTSIYDLKGGVMAWQNTNLPFVVGSQPEAKDLITQKEFDAILNDNPLILIDFYAPWCSPCIKMEPFIKNVQNKYSGKISIQRINIDEAKTLAKQLKVESLPNVVIYKDGKEVKRGEGFQSEEALDKLIKSVL